MSAAAEKMDVMALREARDKAQTEYAHTRQRCVTGQATQAQMNKSRSAYMLAQSEYRAALITQEPRHV